jgi:hypothetical protein
MNLTFFKASAASSIAFSSQPHTTHTHTQQGVNNIIERRGREEEQNEQWNVHDLIESVFASV